MVSPVPQAHEQRVCVGRAHSWTWTWVGQPQVQTWVGAACRPAALWAEVPAWLALSPSREPGLLLVLPLCPSLRGALSHSRT